MFHPKRTVIAHLLAGNPICFPEMGSVLVNKTDAQFDRQKSRFIDSVTSFRVTSSQSPSTPSVEEVFLNLGYSQQRARQFAKQVTHHLSLGNALLLGRDQQLVWNKERQNLEVKGEAPQRHYVLPAPTDRTEQFAASINEKETINATAPPVQEYSAKYWLVAAAVVGIIVCIPLIFRQANTKLKTPLTNEMAISETRLNTSPRAAEVKHSPRKSPSPHLDTVQVSEQKQPIEPAVSDRYPALPAEVFDLDESELHQLPIIVGSFSDDDNAELMKNRLQQRGYLVHYDDRQALVRVGVISEAKSFRQLHQGLLEIRGQFSPEAWILLP